MCQLKKIFAIFLFCFACFSTQGQVNIEEFDVFVETIDDSTNVGTDTTILELDTLILDNTMLSDLDVNLNLLITINDTINVSKIHIKIKNNNQTLQQIATTFDPFISNLASPFIDYERYLDTATIKIGAYQNLSTFIVDVWLEDNNGNLSSIKSFDSNDL